MKRLLSAILVLTMILALVPTFALATETEATMDWSQPIKFDFALQTSINSTEIKDSMVINLKDEFKGGNWEFVMDSSCSGLLKEDKTIKLRKAATAAVVDYVQFVSNANLVDAGNSNFAIALKVPASGIYNISANVFNSSSCSITGVVFKNQAKKTNIDIGTIDNIIKNEPTLSDGDISKGPRERVFSDGVGVPVAKTKNWETVTDSAYVDNHIILTFKEHGDTCSSFIYNFVFTPSTITAASAILSSTETECVVGDTFIPSVALTIDGLSSAKTFKDLDMAGIVLGVKEPDAGVTVANNVYTVAESGEVTFTPTVTVNGKTHDAAPITLSVAAPVEPEEPVEDEALTNAFNPTPVDVPTQYAPSVSPLKYVNGAESNADAISVSAKDEDGDGIYNVSTSTTDNSYKFLYWLKGKSTSKIIVSCNASFDYTPGNGDVNYLIAVYEKDGETKDKAEFYNANGQLIASVEGRTVETPDLPSMAGYGAASKWVNANGDKFGGKENVNISGTAMFIAEYAEPTATFTVKTTKCETDKTSYKYGDLVKCTATGTTEDGTFKCWKRDGVIVSIKPTYSFSAWKNHKVEAVYTKDEFTFNGAAQQIILEIFGDNVMAEFIGFTNVVEKGVILGTQEIAMTTNKTQFTVENNVNATTAKGYVIVKEGTKFKKYTDSDITLTPDAE